MRGNTMYEEYKARYGETAFPYLEFVLVIRHFDGTWSGDRLYDAVHSELQSAHEYVEQYPELAPKRRAKNVIRFGREGRKKS